ncbi:flagellar protein export ATPase FliI [Chromobacterium sp. CV08]|uniref:flagellar protein export ATPase FliI n=1 Tax=Chromobacterium sp. CV08 TaxID=3133274 RepID=UPI003DAA0965
MLRQALSQLSVPDAPVATVSGKLVGVSGLLLESVGCPLQTGQRCLVETGNGGWLQAQVVGFRREVSFLMPFKKPVGLSTGARVLPAPENGGLMVGHGWLGRIVNGLGEPLDDKGRLSGDTPLPAHPPQINPLRKKPVDAPLDVGVRAINGLLTMGRGQRVGLFAGSGVGKSVLLGMITRHTEADVVVVGLIGERGREVREFVEHALGPQGLAKAVLVVAPADESPLMRLKATELCHTLAAHYRDRGRNVLLLVDSLTRYAMAQREVALALGEPPATRGYPPSVFGLLPSLAESAGNGEGAGSMSAIYTVLAEGDDQQDPVADTARAILDGHIVLSRELAERGHYPAIDISRSVSRCMGQLADAGHGAAARDVRGAWSRYQEVRGLLPLGAYVPGADAATDRALRLRPQIEALLCQAADEAAPYADSLRRLQELAAS